MKWNKGRWSHPILGLVVIMAACKNSPEQTKLAYMPDMADGPIAKPQRSYLEPPEGSVARNAMLYPPADRVEDWEKLLHNPYVGHPREDYFRQEGEQLYLDNCSPCHGMSAKGDGTIIDKYPPPPDITAPIYAQRSDGAIFRQITMGGAIMPPRGEHTYPHERWKIILHLRYLQKQQAEGGLSQPPPEQKPVETQPREASPEVQPPTGQ